MRHSQWLVPCSTLWRLAIDKLGLDAALASIGVLGVLFVAKYYAYLWTRTIVPKFWRYAMANIGITVLSTATIVLLVKRAEFDGWLSTAASLGFFMFVRYVALSFFRVI